MIGVGLASSPKPSLPTHVTPCDILLVAVACAAAAARAYLRRPEHKAFVLMLPIPFAAAYSSTNVVWPDTVTSIYPYRPGGS